MTKTHFSLFAFLFSASLISRENPPLPVVSPLHVEIKKEAENYKLLVNSQPYYIKGAGGYSRFEELTIWRQFCKNLEYSRC
jgi:hypothetical protein